MARLTSRRRPSNVVPARIPRTAYIPIAIQNRFCFLTGLCSTIS
jgi:hypothetical protein